MGRPKSLITKVTTSITLPQELVLKLKHLAVDNNTSLSETIEKIVTKHFDKPIDELTLSDNAIQNLSN